MAKLIFCLVGLFSIVLVSAQTPYRTDPDCSKVTSSSNDIVCEKWDQLRFWWDPKTVLAVGANRAINAIPLSTPTKSGDCKYTDPITGSTWFGYGQNFGAKNSVVALYDVQGQVAGIQTRFRHAVTNVPGSGFRHDLVPMFQNQSINGELYYVLTAYFVDPNTICASGRPKSAVSTNDGTGDRLVFQNGPDPSFLIWAPRMAQDALANGYSNNTCFPTMGYHTFSDVESWTDTNCNQIRPPFLLYNEANYDKKTNENKGYLVGFGFAWVGLNEATTSFETPGATAIKTIVGKEPGRTPQCILDYANDPNTSVTTMHVFFVNRNPSKVCPNKWFNL